MPFVLRKIRKAKWYKSNDVPWLSEDNLQADALVDLTTKGNKLSVYLVDDDYANLEQVVAALGANCDYISDFEYALFNSSDLSEINIEIESSAGGTPDELVNSWHRDLVRLSAAKIMALANTIRTRAERKRFLSKRVLELIVKAVALGDIDRTRLRRKLIEQIDRIVKSQESTQ